MHCLSHALIELVWFIHLGCLYLVGQLIFFHVKSLRLEGPSNQGCGLQLLIKKNVKQWSGLKASIFGHFQPQGVY